MKMIVSAVAEVFKYKAVRSFIFLTCSMSMIDRIKFAKDSSSHGVSVVFSCDPSLLEKVPGHGSHGIVYKNDDNGTLLGKVKEEHFSHWYKWIILGEEIPLVLNNVRYDASLVQVKQAEKPNGLVFCNDIYVHPRDGISVHTWAQWDGAILNVTHERERIQRRLNLKGYPLRIATPVSHYFTEYHGTFREFLVDDHNPEQDSAIRCGFRAASHLVESLNASEVLVMKEEWISRNTNKSMLRCVELGMAEIGGGILRPLPYRMKILDFIVPIWPFSVGFTYLAERESNSNMFIEPFSPGVWWSTLGVCVILALCQRLTARQPVEKEGAFISVLATWLQQDASAVPDGASGRWSFMVMSTSAMLVHSYYTSAIVSALMSAGISGPTNLRELADSKYAIASEDYDYMRQLMFDAVTNITDLEYLKKRKMTSNLYQSTQRGVELIQGGRTAYHTEYNQIFPLLKTFSDDQLCKIKHVDTFSEIRTFITTKKRSQWIDVFRSQGSWLLETGLAVRIVSRLRMRQPPCRASLLAERVKFGDVIAALGLTALGVMLSVIVLAAEILHARLRKRVRVESNIELVWEF